MDRLLTYIFIWLFVNDENRIKRAMSILFDEEQPEEKPKVNSPKPSQSKREEIIDAINYLKSKKRKTKEDRDKIHLLEVVLKSV